MKRWSKIICALLATTTCCSAFACANPQEPNSVKPPVEQAPIEDTNVDFVKDGKTSYRVLLPETPTPTESFAAGELRNFFKQATGEEISLVYESDVNADKDGKFLAIGATDLFAESKYTVDATLGDDGFKVITYGNSVLMNGFGESGKLYAVYDFLEEQLGFETYAADEIHVDEVKNQKLKDFDIKETPDFAGRDAHNVSYFNNALFATRKRQRGVRTPFLATQGEGSVWSKTLWTHSTHILIRPSEHQAKHSDWFSENGLDLCYGTGIEDSANGAEMRQVAINSLKYYIELQPTAKYFMVGLEDNSQSCGCDKCVAANKLYGGIDENASGPMVVFVNMLAREIDAWLRAEHPERADLVKIAMFAYQASEQPPVTYDEATGKYTFAKEVVPEKNVIIRLAPLSAVYSKNLLDEKANESFRKVILGWSALGADMSVWSYSCPFGAYLYPAYNWHTLQENYRIYKEYGITDILDQSPRDSSALPFHDLRNYIQAELMWDVEQDMNLLIERFIKAYYKDAAPYMQEYFNLINSNYALMERTRGYLWYPGPWESRDNALAEYYPKSYLNACLALFEKAYEAIEKMPDGEEKSKALLRVRREELSPRYIVLEHYKNYYENADLRAMFTQFEQDAQELGLSYYKESGLIAERYALWWNSVN